MGATVLGAQEGLAAPCAAAEGGVSVRDEWPGVRNPSGKAHWFLLSFFLFPSNSSSQVCGVSQPLIFKGLTSGA